MRLDHGAGDRSMRDTHNEKHVDRILEGKGLDD